MRRCVYPVPVHGAYPLPSGMAYVTRLKRPTGDRFGASIRRGGRWERIGVTDTREAARRLIVEALRPTHPCGADVIGGGQVCYRHAKESGPLSSDLGDNGWRSLGPLIDAERDRAPDADVRPAAICDGCGSAIAERRKGWRAGARRFCGDGCRDRYWAREVRRRRKVASAT